LLIAYYLQIHKDYSRLFIFGAHHYDVGLMSVPTERFVAAASLSHRAKLPGDVRWEAWTKRCFMCENYLLQ